MQRDRVRRALPWVPVGAVAGGVLGWFGLYLYGRPAPGGALPAAIGAVACGLLAFVGRLRAPREPAVIARRQARWYRNQGWWAGGLAVVMAVVAVVLAVRGEDGAALGALALAGFNVALALRERQLAARSAARADRLERGRLSPPA